MSLCVSLSLCVCATAAPATLCNNAQLSESGAVGQPTEAALLLAAHRLGVVDRRLTLKRTHEVGFSSENKSMEVKCMCVMGW